MPTLDDLSTIRSLGHITGARHAGQATIRGQFGEILKGGFPDGSGTVVAGSVPLRCPRFETWATYRPTAAGAVLVEPAGRIEAWRAAEATLHFLGRHGDGGTLTLVSDVPAGLGAGFPTCDVVTAIQAVSRAYDVEPTRADIVRLALASEGHVDPFVTLPCPEVLFALHTGAVLEQFAGWLPDLHVVGVVDGMAERSTGLPVHYTPDQVSEFEELRCQLRHAMAQHDRAAVGRVATRSAEINQQFLPKPSFGMLFDIMRESRAAGLSVSHDGTGAALLFNPRQVDIHLDLQRARRLLGEAGFRNQWSFVTGYPYE